EHVANGLTQRGCVRSGKDVPADPRIEGRRRVPSDEVEETAASLLVEGTRDHAGHVAITCPPHVLEHADRDEDVTVPIDAAVVVLDEVDLSGQPLPRGLSSRPRDLRRRYVVGAHADAMVTGHVERQRSPAAPGLDDGLAGSK